MPAILVAEFKDADTILAAARKVGQGGGKLIDAFTPIPVDGLEEMLAVRRSYLPSIMFIGGALVAALAYGAEWYSAVVDYPINSGGRPLHSWPAFMLVPFAVGILAAAICGFAALLVEAGLPRLHHPLFAIAGFERASQDRFFLALEAPDGRGMTALRNRLNAAGAQAVHKVPS